MPQAVGDKVRWHVTSLGDTDAHVPVWSHHHASEAGHNAKHSLLLAASTRSVDMVASNAGEWEVSSGALEHPYAGMTARYSVTGSTASAAESGETREFFIAADQVEWDYAPTGYNYCTREGQARRRVAAPSPSRPRGLARP